MPGLVNIRFDDIMASVTAGIAPQTLATGTHSGTAVAIGGPLNTVKLTFRLLYAVGSAAGTLSMYLATATGTAASLFTSLSQTLNSISVTTAMSTLNILEIDTNDTAFCNLGTGATYVLPVVVVGTTALPIALDVLGWAADNDPASNDDVGVTVTTVDFIG